ncbi:hypothetical protein TNIN_455581 [Trichonephila inaurata madagascariensis]|uniref:Uncharacterized protein n=1 Tax=Trichonephila inaurata madagascariensis TaxID=2747483 RepID=A0A8X6YV21_9ARAC|nr:hypothetical protein TNIN_455581 [Trichonephila inaurata madagascariensis]
MFIILDLLIHVFSLSYLFLEQIFHSEQKATNVITLNAENSFEHTESILMVQDWINNLNLENNLLYYIDEENGDGDINSPVSDIAVLDNTESANKLSVDSVETLATRKQHTPFKISTITLSDEKTNDLSDIVKES